MDADLRLKQRRGELTGLDLCRAHGHLVATISLIDRLERAGTDWYPPRFVNGAHLIASWKASCERCSRRWGWRHVASERELREADARARLGDTSFFDHASDMLSLTVRRELGVDLSEIEEARWVSPPRDGEVPFERVLALEGPEYVLVGHGVSIAALRPMRLTLIHDLRADFGDGYWSVKHCQPLGGGQFGEGEHGR